MQKKYLSSEGDGKDELINKLMELYEEIRRELDEEISINKQQNEEIRYLKKQLQSLEKKEDNSLEYIETKFLGSGKYISNDGKIISTISETSYCLDLKMEEGVYHIKFKFYWGIAPFYKHKVQDILFLGLSADKKADKTSAYFAFNGKSQDNTSRCHIGTIVNSNPNFINHANGSIYEMIIDMNKREFWISHNNSSPVLLVKDLPSPSYPFATSIHNSAVELLSVAKEKV